MRFTEEYDEQKMIQSHVGMCLAFSCEALTESRSNGITYDLNPSTYVEDYFDGIQPSKDEFLQFLESKGFNAKAIEEKVLRRIQTTGLKVLKAQEDAEAFLHLFMTEWYVSENDVKKHIDSLSIYYLLELVVAMSASIKARLLATKRHAENHKMKAEVFIWLNGNMQKFRSMDAAAEAVTKQQPIAFRTAREWTGEWKKLRSAGTP